jgi:hypothetical protein
MINKLNTAAKAPPPPKKKLDAIFYPHPLGVELSQLKRQ